MPLFKNRFDAGKRLAARLDAYAGLFGVRVLGVPRGGVAVAFEVARALAAPLDVFLVRRLRAPGDDDRAIGAVATGGVRVLNDDLINSRGIAPDLIEALAVAEEEELVRGEILYRGHLGPIDVRDRVVILVDDGITTGASMLAAAIAIRDLDPAWLVAAVPVADERTCEAVRRIVDDTVCASTSTRFRAIGHAYADFSQTSDDEVQLLLARSRTFTLVA